MTLTTFRVVFFGTLLLVSLPVAASADSIDITYAAVQADETKTVISANAIIELNSTIERGLKSGVPLEFVVDVKIIQPSRWWFDKTLVSAQRRYSLTYYELTRHYRVSVIDEDITVNFRSLLTALEYMGDIAGIQIDDNSNTSDHPPAEHWRSMADAQGAIRVFLDTASLPLPLRPQLLVSDSWRLHSEEYRWAIN